MKYSSYFIVVLLSLVSVILHRVIVFGIKGEIVSCSSPQVKSFLLGKGHADTYDNLKITFRHGIDPHLILRHDNGTKIQVIHLAKYSTSELHTLMIEKGFSKKNSTIKSINI
eukprot:gene7315-9967_t